MDNLLRDVILIAILFLGNLFIENYKYYFSLIYAFLILYHIYALIILVNSHLLRALEIKYFLIDSIILYFITYFFICDPNPFLAFLFYYIFYPNFIKAIIIITIHTYYLSISRNYIKNLLIISSEESSFRLKKFLSISIQSYFLSNIFLLLNKKKLFKISFVGLIILLLLDILLFENRIALWVYFNKKDKTLPISHSKDRLFYIASNVVNIEHIVESYVEEMKKLINYLGNKNTIISIVENGDSVDNTREYLQNFQNYLNNKKILNKFILQKEIENIGMNRMNAKPFIKDTRLRIEFYAKLRNKCFDYLYELPNIDYDNIIVIFFNDVIFKYEDIINLLSTNKENFDSVCGLDMVSHYFYDRWVTIDFDGNGLKKYFPFFINKEAQDLIMNHKPVRVFSCWNGVIAFKGSSLKDKRLKFRHKINYTLPKHLLNNPNKNYFESECTYFNIDLFSLGYNKTFINPDVRVAYNHKDFFNGKYYIPSLYHIIYSFILYFIGFCKKRNKLMSNYSKENIKLTRILKNWYIENRIN